MGAATTTALETKEPARPLAANLGWLLAQTSYALQTEMSAALEDLSLSPRGYCVLTAALTGEHTQKELADAVGLDKTTMVVTIDDLEAAGLAKRLPSKTDRRAHVIAVTKAGERKLARAKEVVEQVQADVLEALPPRERDALLDALGKLACGRLSSGVECSKPVRRRS